METVPRLPGGSPGTPPPRRRPRPPHGPPPSAAAAAPAAAILARPGRPFPAARARRARVPAARGGARAGCRLRALGPASSAGSGALCPPGTRREGEGGRGRLETLEALRENGRPKLASDGQVKRWLGPGPKATERWPRAWFLRPGCLVFPLWLNLTSCQTSDGLLNFLCASVSSFIKVAY